MAKLYTNSEISPRPVFPQSFNRYSYVQNDPVNFVDPTGLNLENPAGKSRPDPLDGGVGIFSPGIHTWTFYTMVGREVGNTGNLQMIYSTRDPYTGVFVVGGSGGGGGGGTGGGQNLTPQADPAGPVDRAAELLGRQDCANFIAELISITASLARDGALVTPSFGPLIDPGGGPTPSYDQYYGLNEYRRAASEGRVSASGRSGRSGDIITYGTTTNHNTISWNREFYGLGRDEGARQIIHESLHLIPNFSDFALAGAASIIATRGRNNPGNTGNFRDQSAASIYLNQQIARHCR